MTMRQQVTYVDGEPQSVTVVTDNEIFTALADHHPNFQKILDRLNKNPKDAGVVSLFDVAKSIVKRFKKVSERVNLAGGNVLFDGEPVTGNESLVDQILKFDESDADFAPLVNFLEKVMDNPSENSREQLFTWVKTAGLTLTPEGDIVAYKGVFKDGKGSLLSIHQGPGIVDGKPVNGRVPNTVGSVVEMARSEVTDDPNIPCHSGLHVGNFRYAKDFAQGAILKVTVNPRDWVSVPRDSNCEKGRVCRYKVIDVVTGPVNKAVDDDERYTTATITVSKVDTRQNHKTQKRGPNGRFLPKNA